ncbi:hypothetical protein B0H19DRAFT_1248872 [Mycena capillaripes]|nr:hypothetical protein B0H19DRAFT_1248872 [Mycena capillaripes]
MYSNLQGRRVVSQSPRIQEGLAHPALGAPKMTLNDVYALVKNMEARMVAQEKKLQTQEELILLLQRDNCELWQEIHRLRGPRFPFEIFSLIILSTEEKKALQTFSLVSRGWMSVARRVLFKRITHFAMPGYFKIHHIPILSNEYCTVFPYVQTIEINGSTDDGSEYTAIVRPDWMDAFLRLIPKFTALRCLNLCSLDELDLHTIQRVMPPSIRNNIQQVWIDTPYYRMSQFASFIAMFTSLETLSFSGLNSKNVVSEFTQGLVFPPSSVKELLFWTSDLDNLAPTILKWFIDLHSGVINSIDPGNLPINYPLEFGRFLTRFGATLSKIKFMICGKAGAVQFLRSGYLVALPQLQSIQLEFWQHTFSYSYFDKSFLSTIEWLPKIIALLPPSIEEITLSMEPNNLSHTESAAPKYKLGTIDWSRLDRSLNGSQYPSLRVMKIRMLRWCCPDWKEVNQYMKEMWPKLLPICATKGILEAQIVNHYGEPWNSVI